MTRQITIYNTVVEAEATSLSLVFSSEDMQSGELERLRELPRLRNLSLGCTNLNDSGLAVVVRAAPALTDLNLQETEVTNAGLASLSALPALRSLRLKDNPQLTNACVPTLARLASLRDLQLHETSIDLEGLAALVGVSALEDLMVDVAQSAEAEAALLDLSRRLPGCAILAKGWAEFCDGKKAA